MNRPSQEDYPLYFDTYVSKIPKEKQLLDFLKGQEAAFIKRFDQLDDNQMQFRYDIGKWNLKQVIIHINDVERVFSYRAHAISRGEPQALLSFDHNIYMDALDVSGRSKEDLLNEYSSVRQSTLSLLESFSDEQWNMSGFLGDKRITVKALAFMIAGHEVHHREILDNRYLSAL